MHLSAFAAAECKNNRLYVENITFCIKNRETHSRETFAGLVKAFISVGQVFVVLVSLLSMMNEAASDATPDGPWPFEHC